MSFTKVEKETKVAPSSLRLQLELHKAKGNIVEDPNKPLSPVLARRRSIVEVLSPRGSSPRTQLSEVVQLVATEQ